MEIKQALSEYTKAVNLLKGFEEKNASLLYTYKRLQEVASKTEEDLKVAAREYGESIENKIVSVKVSKKFRKYYDYSIIQQVASPKELKLIKEKAVEESVDKEKLELMVKEQEVRPEVMHAAFKEEELTSSVKVSLKGAKDEEK